MDQSSDQVAEGPTAWTSSTALAVHKRMPARAEYPFLLFLKHAQIAKLLYLAAVGL